MNSPVRTCGFPGSAVAVKTVGVEAPVLSFETRTVFGPVTVNVCDSVPPPPGGQNQVMSNVPTQSCSEAPQRGQFSPALATGSTSGSPFPMAARKLPSGVLATPPGLSTPFSAAHRSQRCSVVTCSLTIWVRWITASRS